MTTSVIVWQCIIILCYILQPVCTASTLTSKSCYGSSGPPCVRHDISCSSNQKIAIYDAYYTDNTECGAGLSSCATVNPDSVTERGHHRFNNTELVSLYNSCSTETQCVYRAPRRSLVLTFSVVKYQCIKEIDLLNISGGVAVGLSQVSLTHGDQRIPSSTSQTDTYVCTFKSNVTATRISVYALDARSGKSLSKLSVLPRDVITTNNCSTQFIPFERLNVTAELPVSLYFSDIPSPASTLVWLLINASDPFNVKCDTETVTSTGAKASTTPIDITSTVTTRDNTQTTRGFNTGSTGGRSPVSTSSQFPAGVFVGGVAVGVVIVILIGLAVYVFVVRRRYDLTVKQQGDAPVSTEHPSYSGLSAVADVNNYDIIEQTSKFQGETAHEMAATPDYQNL